VLQLFKMFEAQEPFCRVQNGARDLEAILRRPSSTIFDLARAAVAVSQGGADAVVAPTDDDDGEGAAGAGGVRGPTLAAPADAATGPAATHSLALPVPAAAAAAAAAAAGGSSSAHGGSSPGAGSGFSDANVAGNMEVIALLRPFSKVTTTRSAAAAATITALGALFPVATATPSPCLTAPRALSPPAPWPLAPGPLLALTYQLNIMRNVEELPTSSLAPAGLSGSLSLVLRISTDGAGGRASQAGPGHSGKGSFRAADGHGGRPDVERRVGRKHCVVMDGVFSYLPPPDAHSIAGGAKARVIGSTENRSTSFAGYVVRKEAPTRFSLTGSRGEATALLLTADTAEECDRWCKVRACHQGMAVAVAVAVAVLSLIYVSFTAPRHRVVLTSGAGHARGPRRQQRRLPLAVLTDAPPPPPP